MSWLILDDTNTLERESRLGFSLVEGRGERELQDLPRCPICHRPVWAKKVTWQEQWRFTGLLIGDVAWKLAMDFVVSRRFADTWESDGMKGLTFSDKPIEAAFRAGANSSLSGQEFFLAYPAPLITQFTESAGAEYRREPKCSTCMASEVMKVEELKFFPKTVEGYDCFVPSCLPGWVVVSERFPLFVSDHGFQLFEFMRGFERNPDSLELTRKGCLMQMPDRSFKALETCRDRDIADLYRHWAD